MSRKQNSIQATVLIVDDQATARFLASHTLKGAGFAVLEAHDGESALDLIETEKPDVVLLDLMMPGIDGYVVCQKIRAHTSLFRTPVLMITGVDDEESIERSYQAGATDFISKPFKRYVLIQRVLALIRAYRTEEDLHRLAYFDSLTSLSNRTSFHQHLATCMGVAESTSQLLSVLYLDLDDFKRINDTLGHEVGDLLLKKVSSRLQESVRHVDCAETDNASELSDMVARLGGDEFIIVLPNIKNKLEAEGVAKRICQSVSRSMSLSGYDIFITCSIGIALFPDDSSSSETLLKHADNALYAAKSIGKNNYRFYDESMNSAALQRLAIDNQLRHALDKDEFQMNYQPQIDAYTGRICGLEALLRWNSTELGAVSPAEFVPVAEENGLIVGIGEWVLRTVCGQAKEWNAKGHSISRVSVNISVAQFTQPEFPQLIAEILNQTGLPANVLELEITESLLAKNVELAIETLTELKAVGVQLSIDDFGTGYSSLSYLKKFPLDRLKIDKSFVSEINLNVDDAAIATAITSMAKSMGLDVIAEGVETEEQLNKILQCGCREIQGYYFSRPLSVEDTESFIENSHAANMNRSQNGAKKPSVLFVDSDLTEFAKLEPIIQTHYFNLLTASTAITAHQVLANCAIDIIVVDCKFSDATGADFMTQIDRIYPDIISIVLSEEHDTHSLIEVVNECRVFRVLEKPVKAESLLTAIEDALNVRVTHDGIKAA